MKKLLAIMLATVLAFSSLAMAAYAEDSSVTNLSIVQQDEAENDADRYINWYAVDNGEYYLFVPSSLNLNEALITVSTSEASYSIDGIEYTSSPNASILEGKDKITLNCGGSSYVINIINGSDIPNIFITTESGNLDAIHADKSHEESGLIEITDYNGKTVYDGVLETIKGRGNTTWDMPKKPYNIKLDKKTDLFGMGKSKKWSLIANHSDSSLIRNAYIYYAALKAGLEYTPMSVPCDLYINNDYQGSYILTTRVEVDETRVDIKNLEDANEEANEGIDIEKDCEIGGAYGSMAGLLEGTRKWVDIPNEPDDITGGYIIEMELANRYIKEVSGFVSNKGQPFTMKSPEYASKGEVEYISDYYQRFEDAVFVEDGKNSLGEHYTDLGNIESFAAYYAFNEWTSNMDYGLTSTFLYKPAGDVLFAGPIWDYDIALGNNNSGRFGCDYMNPEEFTVCFGRQFGNTIFLVADIYEVPTLFGALCQRPEFVSKAKEVWDGYVENGIITATEEMPKYVETITDSAVMNAIRWNIFRTYDVAAIKEAFLSETDEVLNFAKTRTSFLDANLGTVQVKENQDNFFMTILKKMLTSVNNMVEKIVVLFGLENWISSINISI